MINHQSSRKVPLSTLISPTNSHDQLVGQPVCLYHTIRDRLWERSPYNNGEGASVGGPINLSQCVFTASCPQGWVPFKSSCYKTGKGIEQWSAAQKSCELSLQRAHLADIETEEEYLFISSYLKTFNHVIMLWIGLNDKQVSLFFLSQQ